MKIQYYTKDRIPLSLSNLTPHLPRGVAVEKLYDLGEDYPSKPVTLHRALDKLFPHLTITLDRIYDRPDGKYYRHKIVDSLGNIDYLKFIYK